MSASPVRLAEPRYISVTDHKCRRAMLICRTLMDIIRDVNHVAPLETNQGFVHLWGGTLTLLHARSMIQAGCHFSASTTSWATQCFRSEIRLLPASCG